MTSVRMTSRTHLSEAACEHLRTLANTLEQGPKFGWWLRSAGQKLDRPRQMGVPGAIFLSGPNSTFGRVQVEML